MGLNGFRYTDSSHCVFFPAPALRRSMLIVYLDWIVLGAPCFAKLNLYLG